MIRNLKILGLALVAALAMSAMVASAASAATFTASNGLAIIRAETTFGLKFTVTGSEVNCNGVVFEGTTASASFSSITLSASFSHCTSSITAASVTGFGVGGCDFVFYASGTVDLVCAAGKDVTIDAGPCVVHIPAQTGLGTVSYTNNWGHVDINFNLTKIKGTHTDGFLCPFAGSGENTSIVLETPFGSPATAVPSVGTLAWDK